VRTELIWLTSNMRHRKVEINSGLSPNQILENVRDALSERAELTGFVETEDFAAILEDFSVRGPKAIESRGLWGRIDGSHFYLAAVSDYRFNRYLIPRIAASVTGTSKGSAIIYKISPIQTRQIALIAAALIVGLACIILCASIAGSNAIALLGVLVGIVIVGSIIWFVVACVPLAASMASYLEQRIGELVGGD